MGGRLGLKNGILIFAVIVFLGSNVGNANATDVASQLFTGFQGLSDNSGEFLVDVGTQNGTLDVGDRLAGIISFNTIEQGSNTHSLGLATPNDELTGVFDITVLSKSANGAGGFNYVFGASTLAQIAADLGSSFGAPAGTTAILWDDATHNFTREGVTLAQAIASATGGTKFWTLGFTGTGAFWVATAASDNVAAIGAIPFPGNGGQFNFGQNQFTGAGNGVGPALGTVPCLNQTTVNFCGSGSLLGTGGTTTPFQAYDDSNVAINNPPIPEPASLLLLGSGLIGLAAWRRRRANSL